MTSVIKNYRVLDSNVSKFEPNSKKNQIKIAWLDKFSQEHKHVQNRKQINNFLMKTSWCDSWGRFCSLHAAWWTCYNCWTNAMTLFDFSFHCHEPQYVRKGYFEQLPWFDSSLPQFINALGGSSEPFHKDFAFEFARRMEMQSSNVTFASLSLSLPHDEWMNINTCSIVSFQ